MLDKGRTTLQGTNVALHPESPFDLLVVGGGIQGACLLREAAMRGKRCLLLEQGDFGSGTSSASLKVIHGGLRYLQHLNLKRMRESILSRRLFQQVMPHLTLPVRFVMPTRGWAVKGRMAFRIALMLNEMISWDRNHGVPRWRWIRNGRVVDKNLLMQWFPGLIANEDWTGAGVWDEVVLQNTERAAVEFLIEAMDQGAKVLNYHRVEKIAPSPRGWRVTVRAVESGEEFEVDAPKLGLCTGPEVLESLFPTPRKLRPLSLVRAVNLVVNKRLVSERALGLEGGEDFHDRGALVQKGQRLFFMVPYGTMTMVGTWYDELDPALADPRQVSDDEVAKMVSEINAANDGLNFSPDEVAYLHVGLLHKDPESGDGTVAAQPCKESTVEELDMGIHWFRSVKYTTAPELARSWARRHLGGPKRFPPPPVKADAEERPNLHAAFRPLAATYGVRTASKILSISGTRGYWLSLDPAIWSGEIKYVAEYEWVRHLDDFVLRRNGFGTRIAPGRVLLEKLAEAFGAILDWDEDRRREEVARVEAFYYRPLSAG